MAQQDILDLAHEKLTAAWVDGDPHYAGADPKAIPIIPIIEVIITIVLPLLKNCMQPAPEVKAAAVKKTLRTRLAVRRAVQERMQAEYGMFGFATHNGKKVVDTILKAGANATPEEIEALIQAA